MEESKQYNEAICRNFFTALDRLKADKVIRGKATFANRYGINRMNLYQLEVDPSRAIFQPSWLYYMVTDYKVDPMFLLTGNGDFYQRGWTPQKVKKLQMNCKSKNPSPKTSDVQSVAK